jgi:hypothetical protein
LLTLSSFYLRNSERTRGLVTKQKEATINHEKTNEKLTSQSAPSKHPRRRNRGWSLLSGLLIIMAAASWRKITELSFMNFRNPSAVCPVESLAPSSLRRAWETCGRIEIAKAKGVLNFNASLGITVVLALWYIPLAVV